MNTPAHLIVSAALFARSAEHGPTGHEQRQVNRMAIAGGFLPDFTLYFAFLYAVGLRGVDARVFFNRIYFEDGLQRLMAIDNSFVLWGMAALTAFALKLRWAIAASISGLVHLLTDFALHNDDARRQFWPISDWVFVSPVSYWDGDHYGNIVGPMETVLCVGLLILLWRRFEGRIAKALILAAAAVQVAPGIVFSVMF